MTQDEIIEMARQAELAYDINAAFTFKGNFVQIEAFAKLVAAKEREACAKVIESYGEALANGAMLAKAIRARGE